MSQSKKLNKLKNLKSKLKDFENNMDLYNIIAKNSKKEKDKKINLQKSDEYYRKIINLLPEIKRLEKDVGISSKDL